MSNNNLASSWIMANWNVPTCINAGTTTRHGGGSQLPYDSLNLASHVGDNTETVRLNRDYIRHLLTLPAEPIWLNQVHGTRIIKPGETDNLDADGIYTDQSGIVCAVLTADCVPLLMCDKDGMQIAAVHIGWRGFCSGIIQNSVSLFSGNPNTMLAWIGPHIGENAYEVGDDVYRACINKNKYLDKAFKKNLRGRWNASLNKLVQDELKSYGIMNIYNTNFCTFKNNSQFFSFRRNNLTGRMASMIWKDK
jgi:polyphenol oxidase